jgi:hypothetical protein
MALPENLILLREDSVPRVGLTLVCSAAGLRKGLSLVLHPRIIISRAA